MRIVAALALILSYHARFSIALYKDEYSRMECGEGASPPASRTNTSARMQKLRMQMRMPTSVLGASLDAYIVPSYDEHQSEVPSLRDRRLQYISGFSGSEGIAVITMNSAALWTDARYRHQADVELDCSWLLMKQEDSSTPSLPQWIIDQLPKNARVGADPRLVPHYFWEQWEQVFDGIGIRLVQVPNNLVDLVWDVDNRPLASKVQVRVQPKEFSGKLWQTKLEELRKILKEYEIDAMVVTALDEIAWLLNIRGKDLEYTPVTKCYLIIVQDQLLLYIDPAKVSIEARRSLQTDACFNPNCTRLRSYDNIWSDLRTFSQAWRSVLLPSQFSFAPGVSEAVYSSIPEEKRRSAPSPICNMKAKKNPTEIAGMRRAHVRDGAAMCDILAYIEQTMKEGKETWTETKVVEEVDRTRRSQENNRGLSFGTIAGYGANGAYPHYQPTNTTATLISKDSTLVLDSGGQYTDGTTDVTRTLHYGKPTEEQKRAYTLVLMASIDLSSMVFPADLNMNDVDVLPRRVLWQNRKDYMHSTGHGIGAFLQAHEAPIQIAYGQKREGATFKPGYFFSNEPGYYEEGNFGVRLENILEVEEAFGGSPDSEGITYLKFKDATLVPYEPKLIDVNMLTLYQRQWLNNYYVRIREQVGAELKKQMKMSVFYWMMNKTVLVPEHGLVGNAESPKTSLYLILSTIIIIIVASSLC